MELPHHGQARPREPGDPATRVTRARHISRLSPPRAHLQGLHGSIVSGEAHRCRRSPAIRDLWAVSSPYARPRLARNLGQCMSALARSRRQLAVALSTLGVVALTACGGGFPQQVGVAPTTPGSSSDPWAAMPVGPLAKQGIAVQSSSSTPVVAQGAAEQIAAKDAIFGSSLRASVLIAYTDPLNNVACTCWLVSLDPPAGAVGNGPAGAPQLRANYYIKAIDANSGRIVASILGRDASLPELPLPPSPS